MRLVSPGGQGFINAFASVLTQTAARTSRGSPLTIQLTSYDEPGIETVCFGMVSACLQFHFGKVFTKVTLFAFSRDFAFLFVA